MTLDDVKKDLQTRIARLRFDASSYDHEADKLAQRAREGRAEANGLEMALDKLKEVE